MTVPPKAKITQLLSSFERRLDQDRNDLFASCVMDNHAADQTGFAAARFIAHRIVGSARIFGCEELMEPARDVERLIEDGAAPDAINQAVNALALKIEETLTRGLPELDWTK